MIVGKELSPHLLENGLYLRVILFIGEFDNTDAYETEEVLLEDKKPEDDTITVRQRLKKVEDRDE